jgi:uncharacterized protein
MKEGNNRYKTSNYNFFFNAKDGTHLAFNAMSGGFAKITASNYPVVQRMLRKPNNYKPATEAEKELWNALLNGQFIIEQGQDELEVLKVRNRLARFGTSTLGLAIAPTLDCNFKCKYCYADIKSETMDSAVQSSLIQFVKNKSDTIKHLNITWLGGEPFLAFNIIKNLTNHFVKVCDKKNINYSAGIITNGYLLSKEVFSQLSEQKINFIQITLDGPQNIHDKRRPLKNGGGTFDTIIRNLENIIDIREDIAIAVRVNIDKMNKESAEHLLDTLRIKKLDQKLIVGPAQVEAVTKSCKNISDSCLSDTSFYKDVEVTFTETLLRKDMKVYKKPLIRGGYCGADGISTFVVDPLGNLYKCWNDVGVRESMVGYINQEGQIKLNKKITKWLAWDPFEKEACRACKFLPICMGGCPYKGLNFEDASCESWRYNLQKMLNLLYISKSRLM